MSSLMRPVGPLSASVYWRRRLVALILAIVALMLLWWLIGALFGGGDDTATTGPSPSTSPTTGDSPSPSATASPTPSSSPTASASASASGSASPESTSSGAVPLCPDEAVTVTVKTDRREYAPDQNPLITMKVVNNTATACRRDVGQAALELKVQAGEQREWSSDDCKPGGEPSVQTLEPGKGESVTITWNRLRSAPDCPDGLGAAPPGEYQAVGRVGTLIAGQAAFTLK